MTIQMRSVLCLFRYICQDASEPITVYNGLATHVCDEDDVECVEYVADLSKYKRELNAILSSLVDSGHLTTEDRMHYYLTHKGLHSFQISVEALVHFLITSVAVPIAVSAVTAIITVLITSALRG